MSTRSRSVPWWLEHEPSPLAKVKTEAEEIQLTCVLCGQPPGHGHDCTGAFARLARVLLAEPALPSTDHRA